MLDYRLLEEVFPALWIWGGSGYAAGGGAIQHVEEQERRDKLETNDTRDVKC